MASSCVTNPWTFTFQLLTGDVKRHHLRAKSPTTTLGLGALGLTRTGAAPARARIPRPFPRRPCFPSHSLAPSNLISSFLPTTPCSAPESPLCDPLCSSKFPFVSSCPWEREREACWLNSASTAEPAPPGPPARQADWRSGRRCWRGLSPQLRERAAQT